MIIFRRLLILSIAIGAVALFASGCTSGSGQLPVGPATEPTSYIPDTPVPEPDYGADQMMEMSGVFVEIEGALVFQSGGEGSPIVAYNLDHERWSAAVDFVKASGVGEPRAVVRGYLLNNGRLAVCRAEEMLTISPAVVDTCP